LVCPFYHITRVLHGFDLVLTNPARLSARSVDLDEELVDLGLQIGVSDESHAA
jgi:hypothetical protein